LKLLAQASEIARLQKVLLDGILSCSQAAIGVDLFSLVKGTENL
jgi:hypothetical protein